MSRQDVNTKTRIPMANAATDISVVLSGGATNINPNLSLGGSPSSSPITNSVLNNLFDDISPEEAIDGHEDYRCFYFFNDGESSVYDIKIWILEDFVGGASMEIGVQSSDEIQRITIANGPFSGGFIKIDYDIYQFDSPYENLQDWAASLQNSFNDLVSLNDVSVNAQNIGSDTIIFDVTFGNKDGFRNHPEIQITDNLTPGGATISVATTLAGSPINTIAPEIDVETTPPGGVGFFIPSEISPIAIARLDPEDGFPIWVKRVVTEDSDPKEKDGFKLRFSAQTLEPA